MITSMSNEKKNKNLKKKNSERSYNRTNKFELERNIEEAEMKLD